jgi:hypothetical protein
MSLERQIYTQIINVASVNMDEAASTVSAYISALNMIMAAQSNTDADYLRDLNSLFESLRIQGLRARREHGDSK